MITRFEISETNLHIQDSSLLIKDEFYQVLDDAFKYKPDSKVWSRSKCSLCLEWATHKLAYNLRYKIERTKDCDLNVPQKWYVKLFYLVLGSVSWILIK